MNHTLCLLRVLGQSFSSINSNLFKGIIEGNIMENTLLSIVSLRFEQKGWLQLFMYNGMMNWWSLCISVWYGYENKAVVGGVFCIALDWVFFYDIKTTITLSGILCKILFVFCSLNILPNKKKFFLTSPVYVSWISFGICSRDKRAEKNLRVTDLDSGFSVFSHWSGRHVNGFS